VTAEDAAKTPDAAGVSHLTKPERPSLPTRILDAMGAPSLPLGIYHKPAQRAQALQQAHIEAHGVRTEPPGAPILEDSRLGDRFGPRFHPIQHRMKMHNGVDFPEGKTFIAPEGGYLVVDRISSGSEGVSVTLYGDSGKNYTAMHLAVGSIPAGLDHGTRVEEAAVLGLKGSTGLSTGPHFHIKVTETVDGQLVNRDPAKVFADRIQGNRMAGLHASPDVQLASSSSPATDMEATAALNRATLDQLKAATQAAMTPVAVAMPDTVMASFAVASVDTHASPNALPQGTSQRAMGK
jgi:murein DD-endopeptidase MepM/ murein hydrolase activator NlpD